MAGSSEFSDFSWDDLRLTVKLQPRIICGAVVQQEQLIWANFKAIKPKSQKMSKQVGEQSFYRIRSLDDVYNLTKNLLERELKLMANSQTSI